MKLLSHDAVRTVKRTLESEAAERIGKLRDEESKLCKSFAALKTEVEAKKAAMLEEYRVSMENLSTERNRLLSEVVGLEKRKREAQRPVDLKLKELALLSDKSASDLRKAEALKEEAQALKEEAATMLDTLSDLKDELATREQDIAVLEAKSAREAEHLVESSKNLSDKWLEYHKQVAITNAEFQRKKFDIESGVKANEAYRDSLNAMSIEQDKARISIRDGYESLLKAREEILGRKT